MATLAPLYLDAARLGVMSPTAQLAARDFARLAGEGRSTLYWERFLRGGCFRRAEFAGLAHWRGIPGLLSDVRQLAAAHPDAPVLLASRAAAVIHASVKQLAERCRRVLTTDSLWPPYRLRLDGACRRQGTAVVTVPVRDDVLDGRISRRELIRRIVRVFGASRCEGVFLSSVSHEGLRIPLEPLIRALRTVHPNAFIVIDGAQEFAQVPLRLADMSCDIYVAGCHKWVGAYQPLAVALLCNPRSATMIEHGFRQQLQDTLFRFVQRLGDGGVTPPAETVNLTPLLCASGALADALRHRLSLERRFWRQLANVHHAIAAAPTWGWEPLVLPGPLRTGILLLRSRNNVQRWLPAPELQAQFLSADVALTTYSGGLVRLSFPRRRLSPREWSQLEHALQTCGTGEYLDRLLWAG